MSTHRDPGNPGLHVDMGAQYISKTSEIQSHDTNQEHECSKESLYKDLLSNEILSPFSGWIDGEKKHPVVQNYVSLKGLNSVVKHFLGQSGAEVAFQQNVTGVKRDESIPGQVLCATSDGEQAFDGVIFTLPIPQLLALGGNIIPEIDREVLANLGSVRYSCRYALGLFYEDAVTSQTWSAKYFDDPTVRFAAWDMMKRNCSSQGSSLLLHTSVPFGVQHMNNDKEEVKKLILQKAVELIPRLQPTPVHSHLICWKYSQVSQVYPESPGCVVLSCDPLVVATGDGWF